MRVRRVFTSLVAVCAFAISPYVRLAAAPAEIVVYAADAVTVKGLWSRVTDQTAAAKTLLASPDQGWETRAPLASPANYVEFVVTAPANTTYHVWVRLRARDNSPSNDSAFLQFSDAVNALNEPLFRIGTTNGLTLNLQRTPSARLSGWGWLDGSTDLKAAATIKFAGGGFHTLRIQTREDGVQFDQIVLSPAQYLTTAPGAPSADTTIVAKPTITAGSTPYTGSPAAIPGTIQVEDFDKGGEGGGYHDLDSINNGGRYRAAEGVDIELAAEGGYTVSSIGAGEWLHYTAYVATAGAYLFEARVASAAQGMSFHLEADGANLTGPMAVPDTGGAQNWTTVSKTITLGAGIRTLRLVFDASANGASITSMRFTAAPAAPPVTAPPATQTLLIPPATPAPIAAAPAAVVPPSAPIKPPAPPAKAPAPSRVGGRLSTITVNAGGDLQSAINSAQPGDTILLEAGATYVGNFTLPVKPGMSYITIRSDAPDGSLPNARTRIAPAHAPLLPKIQSPNSDPAIATEPRAHHYRLMFLELLPSAVPTSDLIALGDGSPVQNDPAEAPYEIVLDHVYIHGDPVRGQRRGVALHSGNTKILNSHISDIKLAGQDSQAIAGWNGPGPYTIENNYLEAAGQGILIGGPAPAIPNLTPADIVIRRNQISRPLTWMKERWTVRSLIDLRNAQRVSIDGNVIENNWGVGQGTLAIQLAPRNQDGIAPWTVVQHVLFTNNIVRHVSGGFYILGHDGTSPTQETNDVQVRNNLFEDVSGVRYGGWGGLAMVNGGRDITFDHNTVMQDGSWSVFAEAPSQNFVFTNNIIPDNNYAMMGTGMAPGVTSINYFFPASSIRSNVIAGKYGDLYPAGNFSPRSMNAVGFVNLSAGNYRLSPSSGFRRTGTDGKDVGCDVDALNTAAGANY